MSPQYLQVPLHLCSCCQQVQGKRLISSDMTAAALKQFRSSPSAEDVKFTVKYFPYQLYPEASNQGEDKYEWYVVYIAG